MAKKLWGGRFKKAIDKEFEEFQKSIRHDWRLAEHDIYHSKIHVIALLNAGILKTSEAKRLLSALGAVEKSMQKRTATLSSGAEDIHTEIQNRVRKKVGKLAEKLHTLRSRNDQIAFDQKWYCLRTSLDVAALGLKLNKSILWLAKRYLHHPFLGYTHTQRAQVTTFGYYLSAYVEMFSRDTARLGRYYENLSLYIGAGALAGSPLRRQDYDSAIRTFLAQHKELLLKTKLSTNSLDHVSDRDFIIELLSILAIMQMHLSRLAEDFILYSTKEFAVISLPESFCTGSSLMPHKKNPDFLELVRGATGKVYGSLVSLLVTMKALPLTYNRDMQLDKEPLFAVVDTLSDELSLMSRFIKGVRLNTKRIEAALGDEQLYATELAEFLVFKGVAFSRAHTVIGKIVRYAEDNAVRIREIPETVLKKFHPALSQKAIRSVMNPKYALTSKKSISKKLPLAR